jgi:hypothetical protein
MKTILLLGHDGYIGHALTLRLLNKGYKVIGVDNEDRRRNVDRMKSWSALPIRTLPERTHEFQKLGNFTAYHSDISSSLGYDLLEILLKEHSPECIVNLAQQPSAPYSQISVDHARATAINNIASTINVLWVMKEYAPDAQLVQIGTMGEYDPAIGCKIPEGYIGVKIDDSNMSMKVNNRAEKQVIFPRSGGSFYHTSKISATYFIEYVCRVYSIRATDIMQGIVYGNWTPEIESTGLYTRLDSDEAFGTVVNRFIVQTVLEHPLTIYGKGDHKRGFLALNDSIQCLMLAIENGDYKGYRVWNQLDTVHSMNEVAEMIRKAGVECGYGPIVRHIDTPRVERTDDFYYNPIVDKLKELGFKPTRNIYDEALWVINELKQYGAYVSELWRNVEPKIKWREDKDG